MSIYQDLCEIATEDRILFKKYGHLTALYASVFSRLLREHLGCPEGTFPFLGRNYPLVFISSEPDIVGTTRLPFILVIGIRDTINTALFHPFRIGMDIFPLSEKEVLFEIGAQPRNRKLFSLTLIQSADDDRNQKNPTLLSASAGPIIFFSSTAVYLNDSSFSLKKAHPFFGWASYKNHSPCICSLWLLSSIFSPPNISSRQSKAFLLVADESLAYRWVISSSLCPASYPPT